MESCRMRRLLTILLLLLPFALYGLWVREQLPELDKDAGPLAALPLLGRVLPALLILCLLVVFILRHRILPRWGQKVAEKLYMGSYFPDEDSLVRLVAEIEASKDEAKLADLAVLVRSDPHRLRGWQELSRLQMESFHNVPAALAALTEGAESVKDIQDRALLYYRAAKLIEQEMPDRPDRAKRMYERAAAFSETVYGKMALKHLD